jgi:hypothetical protein
MELIWMKVEESIDARGHPMVQATHETTLEFTKETHLTKRGDCIVGVEASKGAADLSDEFKGIARNSTSRMTVFLRVGKYFEVIHGFGNQNLTLTHSTDLVIRKSNYTCNRTLMIRSDKAALDLPRGLVSLLRNPSCRISVRLVAEVGIK